MVEVTDNFVSKTELKREAKNVHEFGKILASLTELQIAQIDLPENILDAIKDLKNIKKGSAKKRQSLYLAKLLREIDLSKAQDFVNQIKFESQAEIRRIHEAEDWRDKLISDVSYLTNIIDKAQNVDIQRLRSLVINSQKEIKKQKSKKNQKELFNYLKEIL